MATDVVWTAAIAAAGGVTGALVGGWLSYAGARHAERAASERDREARRIETAREDQRRRDEFERATVARAQELVVEMWGAGSDILQRKQELIVRRPPGPYEITDEMIGADRLETLRRTRIDLSATVERLYDDQLRAVVWTAMGTIGDAVQMKSLAEYEDLRAAMGTSVDAAVSQLGAALRHLHDRAPDR